MTFDRKKYYKEYYITNKEKIIKNAKKWRENNKEKVKMHRKKWRENDLCNTKKFKVFLPIRYGRCSSKRCNTYTMVFSNECYSKGS